MTTRTEKANDGDGMRLPAAWRGKSGVCGGLAPASIALVSGEAACFEDHGGIFSPAQVAVTDAIKALLSRPPPPAGRASPTGSQAGLSFQA